ncbi:MAG: TolC family protein [Candidatus Caenarcaniphilales bacterium]|nr:TolC family protein [Candidatus Caenarcaniphilales bacterium]
MERFKGLQEIFLINKNKCLKKLLIISILLTFNLLYSVCSSSQDLSNEESPLLMLEDVFQLIEQNHPKLQEEKLEIPLANAERTRAKSAFIPTIRNRFFIGDYDDEDGSDEESIANSSEINWQSPFALEFFGGFRTTTDDILASEKLAYPADSKGFLDTVRKQELKSPASTEGIFGLRVPLLEGLLIDKSRTEWKISALKQKTANYKISIERGNLLKKAGELYWKWVKEGINYRTAENLLSLAKERRDFVQKSVNAGLSPEIALTEVQSQILNREASTKLAEQKFQQASIKLKNFLWQENGDIIELKKTNAPNSIKNPKKIPLKLEEEHKLLALQQRPELENFNLELQQLQAKLKLAKNELLPKLDFELTAGQNISRVDGGASIRGSVFTELPIVPLKELSKVQKIETKIQQIELKRKNQKVMIENEIQEALVGIRNSSKRVKLNEENLLMLQRLADGERKRYILGNSTLFLVNQREIAYNRGQIQLVNALADYQIFLNDYQYSIGALSFSKNRTNWYVLLEEEE